MLESRRKAHALVSGRERQYVGWVESLSGNPSCLEWGVVKRDPATHSQPSCLIRLSKPSERLGLFRDHDLGLELNHIRLRRRDDLVRGPSDVWGETAMRIGGDKLRLATDPIVSRFWTYHCTQSIVWPQLQEIHHEALILYHISDENKTLVEINWGVGSIAKLSSTLTRKRFTTRIHLSDFGIINLHLVLYYCLHILGTAYLCIRDHTS